MPAPNALRLASFMALILGEHAPATGATIVPLGRPAIVGEPVAFEARTSAGEEGARLSWDFGDGETAEGPSVRHVFGGPGLFRVVLRAPGDGPGRGCSALVRAREPGARPRPGVLLDTDQRNDRDDQNCLAYILFGELDVLGVASVHHGGGQEAINYGEILHVIDLARRSGLPDGRIPPVFRGADRPLAVPEGGAWAETQPLATEASEAILAAARGAPPGEPAWILPIGPCTNVASAILQARAEGLDLAGRLRVAWLGGTPDGVEVGSFNGGNDPWSAAILGRSGIPTWAILEHPTGASLRIDRTAGPDPYPETLLGRYLARIAAPGPMSLFDLAAPALVIGEHLGLDWIRESEPASLLGPDSCYRWGPADVGSALRVVRDIDEEAILRDFAETLHGRPSRLSRPPAGGPDPGSAGASPG